MTVRAAIVGLGRWGRSLVNAVQGKTDAIQFVAAHTRTRASAEDYCREKNIPLRDRLEDILSDRSIDAVVLATPHSQHAAQVAAATAAGKHIHVEKPLTLDRPSAEQVVAAAKKAGIVLAVGFNRRFHPSVVEIRKRLASGQLGQVMSMVATHTTSTGQFIAADNWRAQPDEAPGGAITAVGVHSIDHMIEFGGEVRFYDRWSESREAIGAAIAAERGAILVPPFDDPFIIAGQGTIGLEILEQAQAAGAGTRLQVGWPVAP